MGHAFRGMDHVFAVETALPLPREEVFAFFANPENLQRITPPELGFRIVTPLPLVMRAGATIDYRLRLMGIPFGWTSAITVWEPPVRFVDEQVRGPYRSWIHVHEFIETAGGTTIRDTVTWSLPLTPIGDLAYPIVRLQLGRIFAFRQKSVAAALLPESTR